MIRYVLRSMQRQLRESRTLFLLAVVGVSLGVASVTAIQTLNRGALQAFAGSVRAVSGQADLSIVGTTPAFAESVLVHILEDADVSGAWPMCRIDVSVRRPDGPLLDVVGVDLLASIELPLRTDTNDGGPRDVTAALTTPGWVAITPTLAAEQGWAVGDTFTVSSGSRTALLTIGALVDFQSVEPLAPTTLAVMDIAWAQSALGRRGLIHQIDVQLLVPDADPLAVAARLEPRLGPGVRILTPEQREQDAASLLAAFRLNLTALSLISVFVGLFLVLTSVQASLVRRRREFGILRCVGAAPSQVLAFILVEAGILGAGGALLGVPLGYLIALSNLETVSGTLTSIYVLEGITGLRLEPATVLVSVAVGVLGAVAGAVWPAVDMARRNTVALLSPVSLHEKTSNSAGRLSLGAAGLAATATVWFAGSGYGTRWGGFAYGALMMLALPLVVPLVVRSATVLARPRSLGLALSLRNLGARLQTSSLAIAALAVTVSMLVGITLLVGSFRETLATWLDVTVRADVYVSTESWVRAGGEALLDRDLLDALAVHPGVAAVEEQRRLHVWTADGRHRIWLNGVHVAGIERADLADRLPLQTGDPADVADRLSRGEVLIGEPLARKAGLDVGDVLELAGPHGAVPLTVAGISYDYTSEGGTAFVLMPTMQRHFETGPPNNAALFLSDPGAVATVVADLKSRYRDRPLIFRSNQTLRNEVMGIFDQTFAVTRTLQTLALLTAVCGVALTLLVQTRERAGELALLRSLGATRRQVFRLFLGEGTAMGSLGLTMGLFGGVGLAALLILVINRQWFGWTIRPDWPWPELLRQAAAVMLATIAASAIPAARAGLGGADQLSRDDL